MSIKLKDTIYDLVNKSTTSTKATQDGSGNTITSTYYKTTGGTISGPVTISGGSDLNFIAGASVTNDPGDIVFKDNSGTEIGRFWKGAGENNFYVRFSSSGSGSKIWHAGNDGTGSGLDADLLDGNHASAFATSGHNHDSTYAPKSHSHSNYVDLSSAQTISGKKTFSNGLAITGGATENTALPYFIGIEAYADGGTVKYISKDKVLACIGAASSGHTHSYLPLSGGTLTGDLEIKNTSGTRNLYLTGSSASLRFFAWSDATYIESGNGDFSKNLPLKITGISGGTGSDLYLNFTNIYCRGSNYINIDSGNYTSYCAPASV